MHKRKVPSFFNTKTWSPCLFVLLIMPSLVSAVQMTAGDFATYVARDCVLNSGDLVVLQQFIQGQLNHDQIVFLFSDVSPLGAPNGVLDAADLLLITQSLMGL